MRAKEFITERSQMTSLEAQLPGGQGSLQPSVARALPAAWVLPELPNQDPYLQYRMGLAMAKARAHDQGLIDGLSPASAFGENMFISSQVPEDAETLRLALKMLGKNTKKKQISTSDSQEATDVNKTSPLKPRKAIKPKSE